MEGNLTHLDKYRRLVLRVLFIIKLFITGVIMGPEQPFCHSCFTSHFSLLPAHSVYMLHTVCMIMVAMRPAMPILSI